ncbi:hypothetical protein MNBD_GAMMA07-2026, partial [hydrothermal vent metagenome]
MNLSVEFLFDFCPDAKMADSEGELNSYKEITPQ